MIHDRKRRRHRALLSAATNIERRRYLAAADDITFGFYWNKSKEGRLFWLLIRRRLLYEADRYAAEAQR